MLIDWKSKIEHLCPNITGIIHVGAYAATEAKYYKVPTKWVEADPDLIPALKAKGLEVYHFAATDFSGTVLLNRMPFKPANSLLQPNLNAKRRKDVYIEDTIEVPAERIETIQEPLYNFLAMDIQGAELNALKGCDLSQIDYIMTEVHEVETYHGCTQIDELDYYLSDFERVHTKLTKHGWGDALFVR